MYPDNFLALWGDIFLLYTLGVLRLLPLDDRNGLLRALTHTTHASVHTGLG